MNLSETIFYKKPVTSLLLIFGLSFLIFIFAISSADVLNYQDRDSLIKIDAILLKVEQTGEQKQREHYFIKAKAIIDAMSDKNNSGYHRAMGKYNMLSAKVQEAYQSLLQAKNLDKNQNRYLDLNNLFILSCTRLSQKILNSNESNRAILVIDQGLRLNPRHSQLLNHKGVYYNKISQNDSSLKYFNLAFNANPKNQNAKQNFFSILIFYTNKYIKSNNMKEALRFSLLAEKVNPENQNLIRQIAMIYAKSGNQAKQNEYLARLKK